jgi:diguanylate cyclase (GGDEF)-like protein/PAS domain S-box-containing protein
MRNEQSSLSRVTTSARSRDQQTREERVFSRLVEKTAAAIAIADISAHDQPLVYVNAAFERLSGYSAREVIGKNCRLLQGDKRDAAEASPLRDAIREGRTIRTVIKNYKKNGTPFWNDLTLAPILGSNGVPTHYFSLCFDITASIDQKSLSERLLANAHALLDFGIGPVFVVDEHGTVLYESESVSRTLTQRMGETVGRNWFDALNITDSLAAKRELDRLVRKVDDIVEFDVMYVNPQGDHAWLNCRARDGREHPNIRGFVIAVQDTTSVRVIQQLAHEAMHDALTHIHNRRYLLEWYAKHKVGSHNPETSMVMWLIDLDQFKALNDSCGHSAGDEYLRRYTSALKHALSPRWQVVRLGGDEFVIVGETTTAQLDIERVGRKILEISQAPYSVLNTAISLSASVGVAQTKGVYLSFDDLLRNADIAMYVAKRKGRNAYEVYDEEKGQDARARNALLRDIPVAFVNREFRVVHQPIVHAVSGDVVKYEALLRWEHPKLGVLNAQMFIDEMSLSGMAEDITLWVLDEALHAHEKGLKAETLRVSLNVWARSFLQPDFAARLISKVTSFGLKPSCVEVEIIETEFVLAGEVTANNLAQLSEHGVRLVIDDFGKGFSNLSYLQRLNVQGLKIDGSFIWKIGIDGRSEKLIRALLGIAKDLDIDVVAEGVETPSQRDFLVSEGCVLHQGYLYGRPSSRD